MGKKRCKSSQHLLPHQSAYTCCVQVIAALSCYGDVNVLMCGFVQGSTLIKYLGIMGNRRFFVVVFFNCLVGYFGMIVWTRAVSSVLYACVLYFFISLVQHN